MWGRSVASSPLPERVVRWFDEYQQDRWWLAHPVGTVRKYADDRGSSLAGLVAFQIFLGMLPLLVVALTVLGQVLEVSERAHRAVLDSTFAQFPVIGARLREDVSALSVEGPWLAVAIVGLLWTAAGIYHSMQLALNQVWNVEGVERQGFVSRHLRAVILFLLVMGAAFGTAFVPHASLESWGPAVLAEPASALARGAVAAVLLLGVFRLVVSPQISVARLLPAAVLGGLLWELLQSIGTWLILDHLSRAQDLYGSIGVVVVALFWINLLARSAVLANEWAVVSWRRLWPRRIAQPPLTEADRRVLEGLVRNERRRPEEHIDVRFDPDGGTADPAAERATAHDTESEQGSSATDGAGSRSDGISRRR